MSHEGYHEPVELLSEGTRNMHRALISLIEELEAIDWYQQRADACSDDELAKVLIHNKNEEIEHAMMTLEWIRRQSAEFDDNIGTYVKSQGPITEVEKSATAGEGADKTSGQEQSSASATGSLGIGSLKITAPPSPTKVG